MFARFDVTAILLGVKKLYFPGGKEARFARCLTRRPSVTNGPKEDMKFILQLFIRHEKDIAMIDICQRGDMIQAWGHISASTHPSGAVAHHLKVSFLDRLMSGYSYHAYGKCMRGEKPSRSDGFESIKKGEPIPDP